MDDAYALMNSRCSAGRESGLGRGHRSRSVVRFTGNVRLSADQGLINAARQRREMGHFVIADRFVGGPQRVHIKGSILNKGRADGGFGLDLSVCQWEPPWKEHLLVQASALVVQDRSVAPSWRKVQICCV